MDFKLSSIKIGCSAKLVEQIILIVYSLKFTWERDTEVCNLEIDGIFYQSTHSFDGYNMTVRRVAKIYQES